MAWAVASVFLAESLVFGIAVLPAVVFWEWHYRWDGMASWLRVVFLAMAFVPAYLLFAASLMVISAGLTRLLGWRTRAGLEERLADFAWPLLDWGRYLVTTHIVRLFAGAVFRSTPVWTWYMRMNGARIGRGVWVNSLSLMDHNLIEIADFAVIGSDVHLSGHLVERGVLRTAVVHIGARATIGISSVVGIGAHVGDGAQVGALSVVPKFMRLEPDGVYAGAPVRRVDHPGPPGVSHTE